MKKIMCDNINNNLSIKYFSKDTSEPKFLICCNANYKKMYEINKSKSEVISLRNKIIYKFPKYCDKCCVQKNTEVSSKYNPWHINLSISTKCNLQCTACLIRKIRNRNTPSPNFKPIESFLKNAKQITWDAGEFYFDKKGRDLFLSLAVKYNLKTYILTNGILYNPKIKIDFFQVSVYGFDKQSYIENTGCDVFNKLKENLKIICTKKNLVSINIILYQNMRDNLSEVINFIKENITNNVFISLVECREDSLSKCKITIEEIKFLTNFLTENNYKFNISFTPDN